MDKLTKEQLISMRFIPPEKWGKDHLSTLIYVETCVVDKLGRIDDDRMRVHGHKYPTALKDGSLIENHDDYDCITDLIVFGLVGRINSDTSTRDYDTYRLTDLGWKIAHACRLHKSTSRNWNEFDITPYLEE